MEREIKESTNKAKEFLLSTQNEEGYWSSDISENKGPQYLQKPISITPQIIETLILLNLKDLSPVNKAIFYCYKEKVEDSDPIELLAYQLKALSYSNTKFIEKKAKKILAIILNKQTKEGYWPSFPKTSNLTNFIVTEIISNYKPENLNKIKSYLLKNKSKDNLGWGLNEEDKVQVSFTANAILTLFYCKEDIMNKNIQEAVKFLESKQTKDGGWPSSNLTYPVESTTYATALVCLVLLRTKDIENVNLKLGIKFLLNSQLENGSWPLKKGDNKGEYFTTCLVVKTLLYYNYLKEKINEENTSKLLENFQNKEYITNYLLNEFEVNIKTNFLKVNPESLLDKILATTPSAVKRRKIILNILEDEGEKDTANIIDDLKRFEGYKSLHKRSHLAQIKNDMDTLVNLGFVEQYNRKYFLVRII